MATISFTPSALSLPPNLASSRLMVACASRCICSGERSDSSPEVWKAIPTKANIAAIGTRHSNAGGSSNIWQGLSCKLSVASNSPKKFDSVKQVIRDSP